MERDGKTQTQLTFEPVNVTDYDVSVVDGSIAYTASNQLLLANADASNRLVVTSLTVGAALISRVLTIPPFHQIERHLRMLVKA